MSTIYRWSIKHLSQVYPISHEIIMLILNQCFIVNFILSTRNYTFQPDLPVAQSGEKSLFFSLIERNILTQSQFFSFFSSLIYDLSWSCFALTFFLGMLEDTLHNRDAFDFVNEALVSTMWNRNSWWT